MGFSIGIVGLPNAGKSTLFKALTKKSNVEIDSRPFTTINPNIGLIKIPDQRLEKIAKVVNPEKVTFSNIEFIDIAGLVKGAHKGQGLGNQFLSQIRNCDAILEVVRAFEISGEKINPESDIETIRTELELKDLEVMEKENLLSKKPVVYLLNIDGKTKYQPLKKECLAINIKDELEMIELSDSEKKELGMESRLDHIVSACYNVLELITFFTVVGLKEARAWTLEKGAKVAEAGKKVHSDFKENFIRAEVVNWEKLIRAGGWKKAKELGEIKTAGRDYIVRDGDVIEFKI